MKPRIYILIACSLCILTMIAITWFTLHSEVEIVISTNDMPSEDPMMQLDQKTFFKEEIEEINQEKIEDRKVFELKDYIQNPTLNYQVEEK